MTELSLSVNPKLVWNDIDVCIWIWQRQIIKKCPTLPTFILCIDVKYRVTGYLFNMYFLLFVIIC